MNRFLGTDRIYRKGVGFYTVVVLVLLTGILLLALFQSFLGSSAITGGADLLYSVVPPVGLVLIGRGLVRRIIIHRIVKSRRYLGNIDPKDQQPAASRVGVSVLYEEALASGNRGRQSAASLKARMFAGGDGWWLYDATTIIYSDKGMPIAERCYTVFEAKLRQIVPHLVFDGKAAKGRQFKSIYSNSQQLKGVLGAEFDRLFATYSPAHHTIETLSFITPEVIEAMQAMGGYDLEFVDNSLLCYAPLLSPARIDSFKQLCFNLHGKVNDNLRLYKPKAAEIKPFGQRLLKNYRGHLVVGGMLIGFGCVMSVFAAVDGGSDSRNIIQLVVHTAVIGGMGSVSLIAGLIGQRRNRRLEQEFLRSAG